MSMSDQEKNEIWKEIEQKSPDLIEAFLSIENEDELKAFFSSHRSDLWLG